MYKCICWQSSCPFFSSFVFKRLSGTKLLSSDSCSRKLTQVQIDYRRYVIGCGSSSYLRWFWIYRHIWLVAMWYWLQEPIRSSFCDSDKSVNVAYSDLITSSQKTLDSLLELQEVLKIIIYLVVSCHLSCFLLMTWKWMSACSVSLILSHVVHFKFLLLFQALLEKNPSILQAKDGKYYQNSLV